MRYSHAAIIIPTYNERENILSLLAELKKVLPGALLIIADDNSPDGSVRAIKKKFAHDACVLVSKCSSKSGRGLAVLRGFSEAYKKNSISTFVEMDADYSHDPSLLPKLIKLTNENTVVCASRYVQG